VRRVSADAGGAPVQLVGWCLGGIMSLLAAAADPTLPINSIATVASPFDFRRGRLLQTLRPVDRLTGGRLLSPLYARSVARPRHWSSAPSSSRR
jgi:polyhydroxyalkanoate synthase